MGLSTISSAKYKWLGLTPQLTLFNAALSCNTAAEAIEVSAIFPARLISRFNALHTAALWRTPLIPPHLSVLSETPETPWPLALIMSVVLVIDSSSPIGAR